MSLFMLKSRYLAKADLGCNIDHTQNYLVFEVSRKVEAWQNSLQVGVREEAGEQLAVQRAHP